MQTPLRPGDVICNRYRVVGIVGQGGMGSIYKAEDIRLEGRYTAVKEIHIDPAMAKADREQSRQQFLQEATVLARLDHPNLPKVSDFFTEGERDFLVMDYVAGHDLYQLLEAAKRRRTLLPERQVLSWAEQLTSALAYLHRQDPPILHRDIKPANIKITQDGLIKLVDFGLVKVLAPGDNRTITILQGRGTILYTPLEQYGGDTGHTDIRSDIYAFSASLYHLLTGHPPVEAKQRFLNPHALTLPRDLNPELSEGAERAILWGIALHPSDRPDTVEDFWEALRGAADPPSNFNPTVPLQQNASIRLPRDLHEGNLLLASIALALVLLATVITMISPATVP